MIMAADKDLTIWEQDAFALSQAAVEMDRARSDPEALAAALNSNLELWIAIRSVASAEQSRLPEVIKANLGQLFHYVAETTLRNGTALREEALNSLINVNLQLSEGLLEGHARAVAD
jgi:hypothetical protein